MIGSCCSSTALTVFSCYLQRVGASTSRDTTK
jgi:hypothetical protein